MTDDLTDADLAERYRRSLAQEVAELCKPYLTTTDVAERYRTVEATVRYWRMTGYGPRGVKVGRRVLYPLSEIERFDKELADQAVGA